MSEPSRYNHDILRDQGEAYASKLRDADVPTACVRFDGTMHDFMMLAALREAETTRGHRPGRLDVPPRVRHSWLRTREEESNEQN